MTSVVLQYLYGLEYRHHSSNLYHVELHTVVDDKHIWIFIVDF